MIVIGIVGSPAGGKSTVAERLQELGATWINADLIARSVLHSAEVTAKILQRFGSEIADNEGQIDRNRLADIVFGTNDSAAVALNYLEGIVHPRTRLIILKRLHELAAERASGHDSVATVLDVPLLFESQWDLACDCVWCVDAKFRLRLARVSERGWDGDELLRRESRQMSVNQKRRRSTMVIDNNSTRDDLLRSVDNHFQKLTERPQSRTDHCT